MIIIKILKVKNRKVAGLTGSGTTIMSMGTIYMKEVKNTVEDLLLDLNDCHINLKIEAAVSF